MQVIHDISEIRSAVRSLQSSGKRVGVVPTMGALHDGHFSLVSQAGDQCDVVVATIFVNPTQFAPNEDLSKYPRTLQADLDGLEARGVAFVFVPDETQMYPDGFSTYVAPPAVALSLEGANRPDHFQGVTTVVMKLFQIIPADAAFFGQKDYQQLQVIKAMVRDLNCPVEIIECPIVREPDGLAMSSRNRYLSEEERSRALSLSRGLSSARELAASGERSAEKIIEVVSSVLADGGVEHVDYVAIADPTTLEPVAEIGEQAVCLVAAKVGATRLIDNSYLI